MPACCLSCMSSGAPCVCRNLRPKHTLLNSYNIFALIELLRVCQAERCRDARGIQGNRAEAERSVYRRRIRKRLRHTCRLAHSCLSSHLESCCESSRCMHYSGEDMHIFSRLLKLHLRIQPLETPAIHRAHSLGAIGIDICWPVRCYGSFDLRDPEGKGFSRLLII
jgi:hypothetical protein